MKILSWDCRGLGNFQTVNVIRSWCWRDRLNIVYVMEIIISDVDLLRVRNKCGYAGGLCISSLGLFSGFGF